MSSGAGEVLSSGGSVDERVTLLRQRHRKTWRNEIDWFWWRGFLEEFIELTLALLGLHKDPAELELLQLSAMAANWLEMREERSEKGGE